jgi:hypothetical protein
MSKREKDALVDCLFSRHDMKLVNVKFCRGTADIISPDEFKREVHSAVLQNRMDRGAASKIPPHSGRKAINLREFVATL